MSARSGRTAMNPKARIRRAPRMRCAPRMLRAPRGRHVIAQGTALGIWRERYRSPERAKAVVGCRRFRAADSFLRRRLKRPILRCSGSREAFAAPDETLTRSATMQRGLGL